MAFKPNSFIPILLVLFFLLSLSNAKFDNETLKRLQGCHKGTKAQGLHHLKTYLARFGYLNYQHTPNHVNSENDEFDQEFETALISYQNFYHLNASGSLDEPTLSQMMMPRCGQPDKKLSSHDHKNGTKLFHTVSHYSFFPQRQRWPAGKSHLTYAFDSGYPAAYVSPVVRAFNKWASATGYFTFSRARGFNTADLKISFQRGNHGDGGDFDGTILAHAFAPTDGRFHYNANARWSVGPVPGAFDLETVAVHEIGHLLGLGHSQKPDAIMYPTISSNAVKNVNSDDIQGIRVLYGRNK